MQKFAIKDMGQGRVARTMTGNYLEVDRLAVLRWFRRRLRDIRAVRGLGSEVDTKVPGIF
jgi:hypothetical protein